MVSSNRKERYGIGHSSVTNSQKAWKPISVTEDNPYNIGDLLVEIVTG